MKKKIWLGVVLSIILLSFVIIKNKDNNISNLEEINYMHADYIVDFENKNLIEEFDYSFIGKIDSLVTVSQYNGNGLDIPYTFFSVKILSKIKGCLQDNIIIKFYGGYNSENVLILLEGMEYPKLENTYRFYCNKTRDSYAQDGRTINESFCVNTKYNMFSLVNCDETQDKSIVTYNFIKKIPPVIFFPIEGTEDGTLYNNFSFETAHVISNEDRRNIFIAAGDERYYKFTSKAMNYLSVYSIGDYDTMVDIYDSNFTLIASNDNVSTTNHGSEYTQNKNFFCNFYTDKETTYYLKFKYKETATSGAFTFVLFEDNWYSSSDISILLSDYNGVDGSKCVEYVNNSSYVEEINYALSQWNNLDLVKFQPYKAWTINDLVIKDYTEEDENAPVAVTIFRNLSPVTVQFNQRYYENMNKNQRIKTCLHEFGHVLGLNEFTNREATTNVMHQGIRELTKLGPADIAAYRFKWS